VFDLKYQIKSIHLQYYLQRHSPWMTGGHF